jgi:hypothetical protein
MKQALGLAVSGTEVRLAHLINNNGQIRIAGLERARLQTTLENQPAESDEAKLDDAEAKDVFGLKGAPAEKEAPANGNKADAANNGNLEILYRLLERYTQKKVKIAFNIPLSMVTYQRPDLAAASTKVEAMNKDSDSNMAQEIVAAHDGSRLIMSYEKHPPTMTLMREVNDFLRGNLFLALMDSTEVALANLARRTHEFEAGKVTAIIYIEDDFTRLLFLRGKDLFHVSSIIHENTASPDILEVIYRKLIYEQDEAEIPELAAILLAGKSSRINAAEFFAEHFETAKVQYLSSGLAADSPASGTQAGLFSEFAVPIALAWKTLEPKSPFFIPTNLLPQEVMDQQQVLKLNYHGYILLALTGLVTFFFTWQILNLNTSIREIRGKNRQLEAKIADNQETVNQVMLLDNQCVRLKKSMFLADSLSRGHNEFLAFLQKLNAGLGRVGNIWVDEIVTQSDGFRVQGSSMNRDAIPSLAEKLGHASLRQMTRVESEKQKAFNFTLERYNVPDTVKTLAAGLSTIDEAQYLGNGKLVFGKESVRPAPATNGAASAIAVTRQNETSPNQAPDSKQPPASTASNGMPSTAITKKDDTRLARLAGNREESSKHEAATNGGNSSAPIVRQAAVMQPAAVNTNGLDKSKAAAKAASETAAKKSALSAPLPNIETKAAEKPADNASRWLRSEAKSSSLVNKTNDNNVAAPASKSTNGATANAESPKSNLLVAATAAKPENAPPVIYRGFSIEAATSYTKEMAEQFASAFRKQGYDAAVERYNDERTGSQKYRVLVGAFATRPAAEEKAAQIAGILMKDYRVVGLK